MPDVPLVTDARPSADDELRARRRRYVLLMVTHLVGLAVGGSLYQVAWGLGLAILIVTGPLQRVAVIVANDSRRRRDRARAGRPADRTPVPRLGDPPPGSVRAGSAPSAPDVRIMDRSGPGRAG